jgi:hypothetical protein
LRNVGFGIVFKKGLRNLVSIGIGIRSEDWICVSVVAEENEN